MRWIQLTVLGMALVGPAHSEDIIDVLRRSQQQRLEALKPVQDGERAQTVRATFEKLFQALKPAAEVELRVVSSGTYAETLHGRVIVANESLADLPEGERTFIIAHEIGHVVSGHWGQMGRVYQRWVPGEVTKEKTDPVAGLLGRDASGLAHRHEYAADAFALQALAKLGWPPEVAFSAFLRQGMQHDTATHPGTRKRVASLRAAQAGAAPLDSEEAE
ncbi:MAG: M48 family metalloprotease [Burkholderiaceae bacterium]